jgi:hypothetical protein
VPAGTPEVRDKPPEKGERIEVDRHGSVGERLLESDTHQHVRAAREALVRDGRTDAGT